MIRLEQSPRAGLTVFPGPVAPSCGAVGSYRCSPVGAVPDTGRGAQHQRRSRAWYLPLLARGAALQGPVRPVHSPEGALGRGYVTPLSQRCFAFYIVKPSAPLDTSCGPCLGGVRTGGYPKAAPIPGEQRQHCGLRRKLSRPQSRKCCQNFGASSKRSEAKEAKHTEAPLIRLSNPVLNISLCRLL